MTDGDLGAVPDAGGTPSRARARTPTRVRGGEASPAGGEPARAGSKRAAGAAHAEYAPLNPVTREYEFVGPYLGPTGAVIALPLIVLAFAWFCRGSGWTAIPQRLPTLDEVASLWSWQAMGVYVAWFAFQALLHVVVPGRDIPGTKLRNGRTLTYRINGWRCLVITFAVLPLVHTYVHPITWILDHFPQFATAAVVFSFALSGYLYITSWEPLTLLAVGGNSGIFIYDFWMGRELNPRVGSSFDLKYFCELRPGLFLWLVIVAAAVVRQAESATGVTPGMWVVAGLQLLYVADSVWCEDCILTTMDIIQDGFGFMLAFGDLAWVPFMYSLQARYLAEHPDTLSWPVAAAMAGVGLAGFTVFRLANAQKDAFKQTPNDPAVKDLRYIQSPTGSRLLADGWWGVSRHINYFGDWLLSLAMCLPTGAATVATYFYPVYFAVLLAHRERRDEHKCAAKYGEAWAQYKRAVPYRIIPYVY